MTQKDLEFEGFCGAEDGAREDAFAHAFGRDREAEAETDEIAAQSKSRLVKTRERQLYSRFSSERQLEEICDWEFEDGAAYHCLSAGDIDSITFLRLILRQQPLDYLCFSTWVLAPVDIGELRRYLEIGRIRRLDSYVGDFYGSAKLDTYAEMRGLHKAHGGRVGILWNHSKTFVGFGPKFDFVIETSANMNTNKRIEQTCVTVDRGLALHYKAYFDAAELFERKDDFPEWEPWAPAPDLNYTSRAAPARWTTKARAPRKPPDLILPPT